MQPTKLWCSRSSLEKYEVDVETEELLKRLGLQCACELCDCGRPHRHSGCKKISSAVPENRSFETDYKHQYGHYLPTTPAKLARPVVEDFKVNPVPMETMTESKGCYGVPERPEKARSCKKDGELGHLSSGDFVSDTVYRHDFPGYSSQPTRKLRPPSMFKRQSGRMTANTEYKAVFQKLPVAKPDICPEKPTSSYSLLYPDEKIIAKSSLKNSIHDGRPGPRSQKFSGFKSNVVLGLDEGAQVETTNSAQFQWPHNVSRISAIRPRSQEYQSGCFTGKSSAHEDFVYDEDSAWKARSKSCREPPSTLDLGMDAPADFNTVCKASYIPFQIESPRKVHKDEYHPPAEKFEGVSLTAVDFVSHGTLPKVEMLKPSPPRRLNAKMAGETSYMAEFHKPDYVERKLHSHEHPDNLQVAPKSQRFDGLSVMRNDFKEFSNAVRSVKAKPAARPISTKEFSSSTQYGTDFKAPQYELCRFTKFMAEAELRHHERKQKELMVT